MVPRETWGHLSRSDTQRALERNSSCHFASSDAQGSKVSSPCVYFPLSKGWVMQDKCFRNVLLLLAATLTLSVAACDESDSDPMPAPTPPTEEGDRETRTIVEVAQAAGNFTTLLAAAGNAGLGPILSGEGNFTVFAPTDAAFDALLQELGITAEALLAREDLATILQYHVISTDALASSALTTGPANTAAGFSVWVDTSDGVSINNATVSAADIQASNGVIHAIDTVLLPPTIADLATYSGQFPTLLAALDAAELTETFAAEGTFTVFAPTEDAFAAALQALGLSAEELLSSENLGAILSYHVLDTVVLSTDLADGDVVTLGGESATVDTSGPSIAGAPIVLTDVRATNGVIHAIGAVMLPPSLSAE